MCKGGHLYIPLFALVLNGILLCEAFGFRRKLKKKYEGRFSEGKNKRWVLRVPVLPEEKAQIPNMAKTAGLSVVEYLRRVGMSYLISTPVEREYLAQLSRVNGDLGRLGGLLKLWLTDSAKKQR